MFEELTADTAPGRCAKCHSIDENTDGSLNLKWKPARPTNVRQPFTTFRHTSHFGILAGQGVGAAVGKGCVTCHEINRDADYKQSYSDNDWTTFTSNFHLLNREVCAECHVADEAGDACTDCHNYHVGPSAPLSLPTRLDLVAE